METLHRRRDWLLAFASLCALSSLPSALHGQTPMTTDSVTFLGRLLELPSAAPRCGDIKVAVGYRFEVLKAVKGAIDPGVITLLVPCPDLKGEGFMVAGADYLVEAVSELRDARSYTIYCDYAGAKVLWATGISKA
mgnify:FL=1